MPRATGNPSGVVSPTCSNYEVKRDVTEEEKRLINMKYNIKRLNTLHNKEMISFKKIKNKFGKKKTFMSDKSVSQIRAGAEDATSCDSPSKISTSQSPVKNERYSRITVHDEEDDQIDEKGMMNFQKALSMPINVMSPSSPNSAALDPFSDKMISDLRIDEIQEDKDSNDDSSSSVSDADSFSKRQEDYNTNAKRNVSEKKSTKKLNKKQFFVHKANSFKKQRHVRSNSPVKNIINNISGAKRKLKFLKLNSIAFKSQNESKVSEQHSMRSHKNSVSSSDYFEMSPGKAEGEEKDKPLIFPIK